MTRSEQLTRIPIGGVQWPSLCMSPPASQRGTPVANRIPGLPWVFPTTLHGAFYPLSEIAIDIVSFFTKKIMWAPLLYYQHFLPFKITDYPVDDHSPAVLDPASSNTGGQRGKVLSPRHLSIPEGQGVPTWTEHTHICIVPSSSTIMSMQMGRVGGKGHGGG